MKSPISPAINSTSSMLPQSSIIQSTASATVAGDSSRESTEQQRQENQSIIVSPDPQRSSQLTGPESSAPSVVANPIHHQYQPQWECAYPNVFVANRQIQSNAAESVVGPEYDSNGYYHGYYAVNPHQNHPSLHSISSTSPPSPSPPSHYDPIGSQQPYHAYHNQNFDNSAVISRDYSLTTSAHYPLESVIQHRGSTTISGVEGDVSSASGPESTVTTITTTASASTNSLTPISNHILETNLLLSGIEPIYESANLGELAPPSRGDLLPPPHHYGHHPHQLYKSTISENRNQVGTDETGNNGTVAPSSLSSASISSPPLSQPTYIELDYAQSNHKFR